MSKHEWILAGLAKPGKTRSGLAASLSRQPSMVTELLKGNRELKASEIPKIAAYLDVLPPPQEGAAKIVGRAETAASGAIRYAPAHENFGEVPLVPGAEKDTVAIEVVGDSLRGVADDGALLYYENLRNPPTETMIGELCVVGLLDERVLVKYLHRGRGPDLFDLESAASPTIRDVKVQWAALVTAIIPRAQAKKIIQREVKIDRPKRAGRRRRRRPDG
jgi:hypothetical protein